MTEPAFNLPNPPIVEAVLDIECDLPPGFQLSGCEEQAGEAFLASYPDSRKVFLRQAKIEVASSNPPNVRLLQTEISALQFLQKDGRQLVQVREHGFSFNRLAPYTGLDDYLPEIESTWNLYRDLANPVQISLIRLRYINRIVLPLKEGRVELNEYFRIAPELPEEAGLEFAGFFNQHSAVEKETGNRVNIVLATQESEGQILPMLFDITVTTQRQGELEWLPVLERIRRLRDLKNQVFKNGVTEKCLDLFR